MNRTFQMRAWHKDIAAGALILLFILPLLIPLTRPTLPVTHDGHHHIYRLFALDQTIRGGSLWPRWLPQMAFGYGFPIFNFYAPLVYYVGEWLHVFGLGFLNVFRVQIALGFILPAWAFYAFARHQLGRSGAFIGALFYTYAVYHVADGYIRAALPEHWAFLYPPLLLLAMWHIGKSRSLTWSLAGGLILAAFFLTHNLSVILFSPALGLYAIGWMIVDFRSEKGRTAAAPSIRTLPAAWMGYVIMGALGVGLTAFFLLPGALEVKYIHASTITTALEDYQSLLLHNFGNIIRIPGLNKAATPSYPLPARQFYFALAGMLAALATWPRLRKTQRYHVLFAALIAVIAVFLMLAASRPFLDLFPQLSYLQFPWRWNAPFTFTLAYLAGATPLVALWVTRSRRGLVRWGILITVIALFAWQIIPKSFPNTLATVATVPTGEKPLEEGDLKPGILDDYDYQTGLWLRNYGGPWLFEYLPVTAEEVRNNWFLPDDSPEQLPPTSGVPDIVIDEQAALWQNLTVSHDQPFTMRWHSFFFPGWEVLVDGTSVGTFASTRLALVTAKIPAGRHHVIFRFGTTPVRQIAGVISLITLLMLVVGLVWKRQWRMLGTLAAVALIALLPLKWRQISANSLYTPDLPKESWTIFEDRAQLLGYHISGDLKPGQTLYITLHWQALRNIAENDQVFIALVDANGRSWSQIDRQPGFNFTPTSRWQPGELMQDVYPLELPPDLPPGVYQLRMGMHDAISGQRRTVHDAEGNTSDQIWLGDVTISP